MDVVYLVAILTSCCNSLGHGTFMNPLCHVTVIGRKCQLIMCHKDELTVSTLQDREAVWWFYCIAICIKPCHALLVYFPACSKPCPASHNVLLLMAIDVYPFMYPCVLPVELLQPPLPYSHWNLDRTSTNLCWQLCLHLWCLNVVNNILSTDVMLCFQDLYEVELEVLCKVLIFKDWWVEASVVVKGKCAVTKILVRAKRWNHSPRVKGPLSWYWTSLSQSGVGWWMADCKTEL